MYNQNQPNFNQQIDVLAELIGELHTFYLDDNYSFSKFDYRLQKLSQNESQILNANLNFDLIKQDSDKPFVNQLIQNYSKHKIFLSYILNSEQIQLNCTELDINGKSAFQEIVENKEIGIYMISLLYKKGYKQQSSDEQFIRCAFKQQLKNQDEYTRLCYALIYQKLDNYEQALKVGQISRILDNLLSMKLKKMINYNFPTFLELAKNALQYHREFGDLLIFAMKFYNVWEDIINRDRKGTFKRKLDDFYSLKPVQNQEYNDIFKVIFPDLMKNLLQS